MSAIEQTFSISKRVYAKELSMAAGARELESQYDVNINSAKIGIAVYGKLVQGLEFKRALSSPDMEYYLERFCFEGGSPSLENPISALWKHISYYEKKNGVNLRSLRQVAERCVSKLKSLSSSDEMESDFQETINKARQNSEKERESFLQSAPKKPKSRSVTVQVYDRNPHVVIATLLRANGKCERCLSKAPFTRKSDNSPYLEVHHKIRLADNGDDSVENAIALCPNCHRQKHYG
ncbi:MAG: 5-methylcytosine-specific restriction protein A [Oleiphilaceae bacterium]|jgi:5-methylcytosine-specific restriction protein A